MKIIKKVLNNMVKNVKRNNYECSPFNYYKPKK